LSCLLFPKILKKGNYVQGLRQNVFGAMPIGIIS